MVHITIELLDSDGRLVTDADREITVQALGPLKLLGLDSGNLSDSTRPKATTRSTAQGRLLAIFQSAAGSAGSATVKVSSAGVPDAVIALDTHQ